MNCYAIHLSWCTDDMSIVRKNLKGNISRPYFFIPKMAYFGYTQVYVNSRWRWRNWMPWRLRFVRRSRKCRIFPIELYQYNSDKKYLDFLDELFTRSVVYKNEISLCNDIFCLNYVKIHTFILFFFQWL